MIRCGYLKDIRMFYNQIKMQVIYVKNQKDSDMLVYGGYYYNFRYVIKERFTQNILGKTLRCKEYRAVGRNGDRCDV
jgi:hypothetical protein